MNDRFEWFLEKATEIGIDTITPIICDHSERKIIKPDRFEKILQSAMKQSLNCYLPKLNEAINFKDFINQNFNGDIFIAHCEESDRKSLKQELKPKKNITILIGPEGDFSSKEIEMAIKNKFIPVTLGTTRLRTETAAIVACHSVAFINEADNGH
jgi:16S rRNA (uracil1498-N3)-methyltransferase